MKISTVFHKFTFTGCVAVALGLTAVSCGGSSEGKSGSDSLNAVADSVQAAVVQAESLLKSRCESANAQFPLAIDDYTTETSVEILPRNMVHTFAIDEKKLGLELDDPKVSKDALYQGILEALRENKADPAMLSEMRALVATGRGILYRYNGSQSGKSIEVEVAPATLRAIVG